VANADDVNIADNASAALTRLNAAGTGKDNNRMKTP
jgi:hypothetical protein